MVETPAFIDLRDRVAIVTGSSRGIGRQIAVTLGGLGASVVVNFVYAANRAEQVVAEIAAAGGKGMAVKADVRNLDEVKALVDKAKDRFGRVDILVNNAGTLMDKPVTFMTDDEWQSVVDVSLKGAFHCIKAVGREMARQKYGRIINISSAAGLMGDAMRANYSAAKAGMIGLTKAVAREFAGPGITVNAVAPGVVETEMITEVPEAKRQKQLALVPLRRCGTTSDVADLVAFLASERAGYITGQVISVDGGMRM